MLTGSRLTSSVDSSESKVSNFSNTTDRMSDGFIKTGSKLKPSSRMMHLDVVRGVTMLLVLLGHVVIFYPNQYFIDLCVYLRVVRMPLFFFISGFLAYSSKFDWTMLIKRSSNRVYSQLYPTIVIGGIYVLFFIAPQQGGINTFSLTNVLADETKGGYWFTIVLFEIFFLVSPFFYVFTRNRLSNKWQILVLFALWAFVKMITSLIYHFENDDMILWMHIFSGDYVVNCLKYFILGCIAKIYIPYFTMLYQKRRLAISAFFCFVILDIININIGETSSGNYKLVLTMLCTLAGIVTKFSLFYWLCQIKQRYLLLILSWLKIIGTSTLQIYLLHYLFLGIIQNTIDQYIKSNIMGSVLEWPFLLFAPIWIAILCLVFVGALKRVGVYSFVFPSPKRNSAQDKELQTAS